MMARRALVFKPALQPQEDDISDLDILELCLETSTPTREATAREDTEDQVPTTQQTQGAKVKLAMLAALLSSVVLVATNVTPRSVRRDGRITPFRGTRFGEAFGTTEGQAIESALADPAQQRGLAGQQLYKSRNEDVELLRIQHSYRVEVTKNFCVPELRHCWMVEAFWKRVGCIQGGQIRSKITTGMPRLETEEEDLPEQISQELMQTQLAFFSHKLGGTGALTVFHDLHPWMPQFNHTKIIGVECTRECMWQWMYSANDVNHEFADTLHWGSDLVECTDYDPWTPPKCPPDMKLRDAECVAI
jgi:hypothetical protein